MSDDKNNEEYITLKMLHKGLINNCNGFPTSIEEVEIVEEYLSKQEIEIPQILKDPSNVFKRKDKKKPTNTIIFPQSTSKETCDNFAQAARDGGEISKSVREKMIQDRKRAENESNEE